MKSIKAGIVGLGFIGRQHVEALRRIPYVQVIAAAEHNPDMEEWCEDNGIPRYYQDYREMFEEEELDVIHNCTPNHLHFPVSRAALDRGFHVYSEKPFTLCSDEALELCKLAKGGKKIGVNYNYRNYAMVQEMKGRIREKRIGDLSYIQAEYLQDWLLYDTDFDWRIRREIGGESRAVADIGSHCFDTIQYVVGEKIVSVYAVLHRQYDVRKCFHKEDTFSDQNKEGRYDIYPVENEDGAMILFRMESGMLGSIMVSQVCAGKKNGLKLLISGTREAMEWNQEEPDKLWVGHRDAGNEVVYAGKKYLTEFARLYSRLPDGHPSGWCDALTNGLREFYDSIRGQEKEYRYADSGDGYDITRIVEACMESSRRGCWVDIKKEEK